MLSRVFRGKFVEALRRAYREKQLRYLGARADLADTARFESFVHSLFRQMGGLREARHGRRAPSSSVPEPIHAPRRDQQSSFARNRSDRVTFQWKDYAHGNKKRKMTLGASEFLRRFVQHVLPRGFVRIRHFGFLANPHRTKLLVIARKLIGESLESQPLTASVPAEVRVWGCPLCGAAMRMGPILNYVPTSVAVQLLR